MKPGFKINLIPMDAERQARRSTIAVALVFTLLVGGLSALGAGASYRAATHGTGLMQGVADFFVFSELRKFVWGEGSAPSGDSIATPDDRLNILLLGIGGAGHEGSQLTDTIVLASYDKATQKVGMVSIPRDMAYPLPNGGHQKINAVNAYAELANPGEGAKKTAEAFEQLFNVRIDRVVRIDFAGFEKLVDAIGGVDVAVERSFTDREYPTNPKGPNPYEYMTVKFEKGTEHMNGERTLQYVRSRHGNNGEAGDFARNARQQNAISAIRERMLSLGILANPKKVTEIWNVVSSHVQTDMTAWDMIKLLPLAMNFSKENVVSHVLTDAPDGELYPRDYMLFPRQADWSEIRGIIANPFKSREEIANEVRPTEPIVLEVKNGTSRIGFAAQVAEKLSATGYNVAATGNAKTRGAERTVIYDFTNGGKPEELAKLKKLLDANVSTATAGTTVNGESPSTSSTQFVIVLGESSLGLLNYAGQTNP